MADKIISIPVGSGHMYGLTFTGSIPADNVIETEENRLGYIEKGAAVQYKPTNKTLKDDLGIIQRVVVTDEDVTLKASLIAWSSANLNVFCASGRITETAGHRTVKIGGLKFASNTNICSASSTRILSTETCGSPSWAPTPAASR